MYYYSTLAPVYHTEGQENAQDMPWYYTVKLCITLQSPGFTGFLTEEGRN